MASKRPSDRIRARVESVEKHPIPPSGKWVGHRFKSPANGSDYVLVLSVAPKATAVRMLRAARRQPNQPACFTPETWAKMIQTAKGALEAQAAVPGVLVVEPDSDSVGVSFF